MYWTERPWRAWGRYGHATDGSAHRVCVDDDLRDARQWIQKCATRAAVLAGVRAIPDAARVATCGALRMWNRRPASVVRVGTSWWVS